MPQTALKHFVQISYRITYRLSNIAHFAYPIRDNYFQSETLDPESNAPLHIPSRSSNCYDLPTFTDIFMLLCMLQVQYGR